MKDFRLYDIADFVMDEDFIRWVQRKDPIDNLFWENWLLHNPSRHLIIAEARQIVEFVQLQQQPVSNAEIQTEIARVLRTIRENPEVQIAGSTSEEQVIGLAQEVPPKRSSKLFRLTRTRAAIAVTTAAAAVTLLVIAGLPRMIPHSMPASDVFQPQPVADLIEKTNPSGSSLSFNLPDGSTIRLAPGSKISYPTAFAKQNTRDVYLSGEAFFSIAKNSAKPFRVFTGELITRVLGTTFSIRGFEKDTTISVTVRTGKVSVWSQSADSKGAQTADQKETNPDGFIVTPNQQLVYHREVKKFQKVLVEKPLFIVSDTVDHSMIYEDTPVEQVFDQLGKYYGINIVYDTELLGKCTVTADLANEPFYHKLDLICKAIGANYEIVDAQVVILSNGCQ